MCAVALLPRTRLVLLLLTCRRLLLLLLPLGREEGFSGRSFQLT